MALWPYEPHALKQPHWVTIGATRELANVRDTNDLNIPTQTYSLADGGYPGHLNGLRQGLNRLTLSRLGGSEKHAPG